MVPNRPGSDGPPLAVETPTADVAETGDAPWLRGGYQRATNMAHMRQTPQRESLVCAVPVTGDYPCRQ
jgi:hypothetical protein